MTKVLACVSIILVSLAVSAQTRSEKELLSLNAQYDAAIVANDVAALDRIFADNFVYTTPEGEIRNKAQQLKFVRSGVLQLESGKSDDVTVRVYGSTAVMTGRFTAKGKFRGEPLEIHERYTAVWVKQKRALAAGGGTGKCYPFGTLRLTG